VSFLNLSDNVFELIVSRDQIQWRHAGSVLGVEIRTVLSRQGEGMHEEREVRGERSETSSKNPKTLILVIATAM
jgi:hypothetical protein